MALEPMPQAWLEAFLQAYATDDRVTDYLLEHLGDDAWEARPESGRSIPAIVAHMHNVRVMWLKATKAETVPEQLDRHTVTRDQARAALAQSRDAIVVVLRQSFGGTGKVRNFPPDAAHFFAYLVAHDAHHRGQICMLARQLGCKLEQAVTFGMWEYGKRSREVPV